MNLFKKMLIDEGLIGAAFLLGGVLIRFGERLPIVILYGVAIIDALLFLAYLLGKILTWRKKTEPVDELARMNQLKVESMIYRTFMFWSLIFSCTIPLLTKKELSLVLDTPVVMMIFGGCKLAYCFLFKIYENTGEAIHD